MGKTALFRNLKRAVRRSTPAPALSRRDFLKASAALAALAVPLSPTRGSGGPKTVILGAGIAGLGAALRLQEMGLDYQIFEAGTRAGGRIWTKKNFNTDGQFAERGGELIDSNHYNLIAWVKAFGLEIESFESRANAESEELYFYGGQKYTAGDLAEGLGPLAEFCREAFAELRAGIRPSTYLGHQHRHHPGVLKYDRMSLSTFLDRVPGLDLWVRQAVETGYVCEFGLEAAEQTSINLLELFDSTTPDQLFGASDESLRIKGGNGQLTDRMFARACPGGAGDPRMHFDHELVRIRERGRGIELTFLNGSSLKTVRADRVICTIPFSVLRRIDGVPHLPLSSVKKRSILELGYGTNAKITMDFSRRIWSEGPISAAGTSFNDRASQSYWESSRGQSGSRGLLTNFRGGKSGARVTGSGVSETLMDLGAMYEGRDVRGSFAHATLTNWSRRPFQRGSYSCLRPGQVTRLWGNNHVPELGGRLYFAGEHTSLEAVGFMEGALASGLRAAAQVKASVPF